MYRSADFLCQIAAPAAVAGTIALVVNPGREGAPAWGVWVVGTMLVAAGLVTGALAERGRYGTLKASAAAAIFAALPAWLMLWYRVASETKSTIIWPIMIVIYFIYLQIPVILATWVGGILAWLLGRLRVGGGPRPAVASDDEP